MNYSPNMLTPALIRMEDVLKLAGSVHERARALRNRIGAIDDELCGALNEAAGESQAPMSSGLISQLHEKLLLIEGTLDAALSRASSIENRVVGPKPASPVFGAAPLQPSYPPGTRYYGGDMAQAGYATGREA